MQPTFYGTIDYFVIIIVSVDGSAISQYARETLPVGSVSRFGAKIAPHHWTTGVVAIRDEPSKYDGRLTVTTECRHSCLINRGSSLMRDASLSWINPHVPKPYSKVVQHNRVPGFVDRLRRLNVCHTAILRLASQIFKLLV